MSLAIAPGSSAGPAGNERFALPDPRSTLPWQLGLASGGEPMLDAAAWNGALRVSLLTRRGLLSGAGDAVPGLCVASSPLLAGCMEPAPVATVPTTAAAPSGGRAPFQIMALKDYAVPPSMPPPAAAGCDGSAPAGSRLAAMLRMDMVSPFLRLSARWGFAR
jgi:hypothetical protein